MISISSIRCDVLSKWVNETLLTPLLSRWCSSPCSTCLVSAPPGSTTCCPSPACWPSPSSSRCGLSRYLDIYIYIVYTIYLHYLHNVSTLSTQYIYIIYAMYLGASALQEAPAGLRRWRREGDGEQVRQHRQRRLPVLWQFIETKYLVSATGDGHWQWHFPAKLAANFFKHQLEDKCQLS